MTVQEAQRAARRGGHRLVDAGRTPNSLYRMLVCARCGGKILTRTPEEAGDDIVVWSCTPREALCLTARAYRSPGAFQFRSGTPSGGYRPHCHRYTAFPWYGLSLAA
jgi:hypothetical protein